MKLVLNNFDLKQIAESGQCFRWKALEDNKYLIPALCFELIVTQDGNTFDFSCSEEEFNFFWKNYFDFDRDYSDIEKRILSSNDSHLIEAYKLGSGIRILKQNLWEMIFSFMISQNNNIKRISNSIELICKRVNISTGLSYKFPTAVDIFERTSFDIFDDSSLGLGYRAPYLKGLCEFVLENPSWLDELKTMSYEEAFNSLIKIKGIGTKVANCICLFGLNHTESFPIDTHVKQLLEKYYPNGIDLSLYPGEAGIIQQYLFYYELLNK